MSTAPKMQTVRDHRGKNVKIECAACWDEFGSMACLRPAHAYTKVKVTQDPDAPVEKEVLATAILQISEAAKKLYKTGLNKKAVVALINDDTKLGKGLVETVLNSLESLAKKYTK